MTSSKKTCAGYEIVCPDGLVRHYPYHNEEDAVGDAESITEKGKCQCWPEPSPLELSLPPCPEGKHTARPIVFSHSNHEHGQS